MTEPECWRVEMTFTQDPDDAGEDAPQELVVTAYQSPGGGWYYSLKSERWAVDSATELVALIERTKPLTEEPCK